MVWWANWTKIRGINNVTQFGTVFTRCLGTFIPAPTPTTRVQTRKLKCGHPKQILYKGIRKRTHDWTLLRFWTPKVHCTFTVVPKSDPDIGSLLFWKRFWTPKVHCTFTVVPKSGPDIDHLLFWKRFWTPKVHHTFASVPKSGPDSLHLPISWHRMDVCMYAGRLLRTSISGPSYTIGP